MATRVTFPSLAAVARAVSAVNREAMAILRDRYSRCDEDVFLDIRLQVWPDGAWALHSGDSQYDQDHRGYWGASSVPGKRCNSREIARDLIEQAKDQYATEVE